MSNFQILKAINSIQEQIRRNESLFDDLVELLETDEIDGQEFNRRRTILRREEQNLYNQLIAAKNGWN